jgi:hypothetical protein
LRSESWVRSEFIRTTFFDSNDVVKPSRKHIIHDRQELFEECTCFNDCISKSFNIIYTNKTDGRIVINLH